MDDFDQSNIGLTDADFESLMSRAVPDGTPPSTEGAPPTAPDPAPSANVSAAADAPPVANAATPDGVVAAETQPVVEVAQADTPPTPDANPSPVPQWDTPDNPYFSQAQQMSAAIEAAQAIGASQRQQAAAIAAQQEYQREAAAVAELMERMPDLDPQEQRMALDAIVAWQVQPYQRQLASREAMLESTSARVLYDEWAREHGLTPEEKAEMEKIHNAPLAEMFARSRSQMRQEVQRQMAEQRAKWEQARLQEAAQNRIASGADAAGGGGTAAVSMANATNIDEFWTALDAATSQAWYGGSR